MIPLASPDRHSRAEPAPDSIRGGNPGFLSVRMNLDTRFRGYHGIVDFESDTFTPRRVFCQGETKITKEVLNLFSKLVCYVLSFHGESSQLGLG